SEKFGTLTLNSGQSTITSQSGSGIGSTVSLTSTSLVRTPNSGATANFVAGGNLGTNQALGTAANSLVFLTPPTLTNGILPFATVQTLNVATLDFATMWANGLADFNNYKTTLAGAGVPGCV